MQIYQYPLLHFQNYMLAPKPSAPGTRGTPNPPAKLEDQLAGGLGGPRGAPPTPKIEGFQSQQIYCWLDKVK